MSSPSSSDVTPLTFLIQHQLDAWVRGERPRIEKLLEKVTITRDRHLALLNLIFTEVSLRLERGELPQKSEYLERFPQVGQRIEQEWDRLVEAMPGPATRELELPTLSRPEVGRASASPLELPAPRLEDFVYRRVLGVGGMGIVYHAQQLSLLREVAIKFLLADGDADRLGRFQLEGQTLASFQHPHIVSIHQTGIANGQAYIVMEYLGGGSLSSRLSRGPLDPHEAVRYLIPVIWAVEEVHQHGLIHRDIKPGNLLFSAKGHPKLADFGLAKWLESSSHTRTGAILGTPSYMAPEQAGAPWPLGPAADIWSLGAVLYACLTGKPPFSGPTEWATAKLVCEKEPAPMPESVPEPLRRICLRCLQKNPQQRYHSAGELAQELERWQKGEPVQTVAPSPPLPPPFSLLSRRNLLVATTASLPLAGLAFWLSLREPKPNGNQVPEPFRLNGKWIQPRWLTDNLASQRTLHGKYCVESGNLALLELLSDPGMNRYRFSVEVQHQSGFHVGLFVGLSYHQNKSIYRFVRLTFDDLQSEEALRQAVVNVIGSEDDIPKGPMINRISLSQCVVRRVPTQIEDISLTSKISDRAAFHPSCVENQAPFRKLEITVDHDSISARMIGSDLPAVVGATFTQLGNTLRDHMSSMPALAHCRIAEDMAVRGGLGLMVERSRAAFRNAKLEELDP